MHETRFESNPFLIHCRTRRRIQRPCMERQQRLQMRTRTPHPSPFAGWPVGLLITSKDDQVTLKGKSDRKEVDLLG